MLQRRSAEIEKESRNALMKVILRLGMQSAEFSQALIKLSNAFQNTPEKLRGIYQSGGEIVTAADGSKKEIVIVGSNYKRPPADWFPGPKKTINKHESYLEVMGLIPTLPNIVFDETTKLSQVRLAKVMSITGNLHKASSYVMDAMIPKNKSAK